MKYHAVIFLVVMACLATLVYTDNRNPEKPNCKSKRQDALRVVEQQKRNQSLHLAIVVPNCNEDNTYAEFQCHYGSNFCQCWDKEGYPMTQPKKNLKKCPCMIERSKAISSIPASQTGAAEVVSCETDGSYTAKQCNRWACWCVNPDTGAKLGAETKDKSSLKCN